MLRMSCFMSFYIFLFLVQVKLHWSRAEQKVQLHNSVNNAFQGRISSLALVDSTDGTSFTKKVSILTFKIKLFTTVWDTLITINTETNTVKKPVV